LGTRYGLQIRAATPADAPGIAELMASSGYVVSTTTLTDRLEALRQERGTALLALEWGPPSGLVVLSWFRTLEADDPVAQITSLLVAPEERRRGIGRMLLKAAAQSARSAGCNELFLFAPSDQPSLPEFSRANGFHEAGARFTRPLRKRA
jgi:N-acetylglutamate synthase-like GNAT family acetyltransferase